MAINEGTSLAAMVGFALARIDGLTLNRLLRKPTQSEISRLKRDTCSRNCDKADCCGCCDYDMDIPRAKGMLVEMRERLDSLRAEIHWLDKEVGLRKSAASLSSIGKNIKGGQ